MQPKLKTLLLIILETTLLLNAFSQQAKQFQNQNHIWLSINCKHQIAKNWNILSDVHVRRTDFFAHNNFYFIRLGIGKELNQQLSIAAGGGHMWLANRNEATELFSNENRLYQEIQYKSKIQKAQIQNRIRIEERWQEKVINYRPQKEYRYSTRIRYLIGINIQLFRNSKLPELALADEVMLQFGKHILYNPFDQNRLFAGLKQKINKQLSFDIGYMHVVQQKLSGYQYSRNKTIRCYFYWKPEWKKAKTVSGTMNNI
jgi:hypothetical protein